MPLARSSPNPSAQSREKSWERDRQGPEGEDTRVSSSNSNATTEMRDEVGKNDSNGAGESEEEEAVSGSVSARSD